MTGATWIKRVEWLLACALSLAVLVALAVRTLHAGPLWRDECDSLQFARLPFGEMIDNLQFTAFPLPFSAIVRAYTAVFGTSDLVLRCFGFAVGILFLGAAWFQARKVDDEVPLLLLVLMGLSLNLLTAGLWVRGYGIGTVLIIFAFAFTARFLAEPNMSRLVAAFAACLVSMQCLFFNGVVVPAIVLAAAIVLFLRGQKQWMWRLLIAAAICGLTYVPYIWKLYTLTSVWAPVLKIPLTLGFIAERFVYAYGGPLSVCITWLSVVSICVVAGVWRLRMIWNTDRARERDLLLFGLLTIPLSMVGYFGFFRLTESGPLQRYFLALLGTIASATTLIAANFSSSPRLRLLRLGLVIGMILTLPLAPWQEIVESQSNVDVVARTLEADARSGDLIVINHWSVGISFNHYYHGPIRWITAPNIEDHRVHRFDLLRDKMMEFFPLDDVEHEIADTLKSGHRVWILGTIKMVPSQAPLVLTPAPDPKYGWRSAIYVQAWSEQLGLFLRPHVERVERIIEKGKTSIERENLWLIACDGWKY